MTEVESAYNAAEDSIVRRIRKNMYKYKYPFYLLKTRRFFPFFLTQFFGALNDNVLKLSVLTLIAFHLVHRAEDNQLYQALGAALFTLPFLLFSAIAGQWADKYDKAVLMRYIKGAEILLMILASIGLYVENISWMMTTIFFVGLHSAFFGPLKYAILPEHLEEKELLAGNAFVDAATFIAILLGTIVGTALIPVNAAFLAIGLKLVSGTLVGIAVLGMICSFFIPSANKNVNSQTKIDWHPFRSALAVLKTSKKYPQVFSAIMGISWFWFVGASLLTEFPSYVKYTLHAEKGVFTLFLMLFSVGIASGSLLSNRGLKGEISSKYAFAAALGMSFFTVDLYFASKPFETMASLALFFSRFEGWRISVDLFLLSVCGGIYITPLYAIIQKYSPSQWCSRMISANNIMNSVFMVASAIWISLLALFHVAIPTIILTLVVGNVFVGFYLRGFDKKTLAKGLLKLLYRVEVHGLENYYQAGERFLILVSYTSFLDIILLTLFLPDSLGVVMDDKWVKKFWLRPFLSWANVFAIKAFSPMAARNMVEAAQKSQKFILAPESYVKENIPLKKMMRISGLVARKTGLPLLPIQIKGTVFLPFSRRRGTVPKRFFPKVVINILPAILVGNHEKPQKKLSEKSRIEHIIFKQLSEMLFDTLPWKNTLFEQLLEMRALHGKRLIAEDVQKEISYNTLVLQSFVLGTAMARQSDSGKYVGVLLPTMINSMICFFALQAFGRIPALLNYSLGLHYLKSACALANIKIIYTSSAFVAHANLQESIEALKISGIKIIYLEELKDKISWADRAKGVIRFVFSRPIPVKSDVPAVILFTSGSEGVPKGVALSHQNLLANAYQMASCVDFSPRDYLFNALPIFHCFGLTAGMILPITQGFSVFFYPSPLHYRQIPEWVHKAGATLFLATDTFLKGYAHYASIHNFKQVRGIFAGAEKVKEETLKTWKHTLETPIFEGYGMTEASPVIAVNNEVRHKDGSVGCLLPGIRYRLEPVEGLKRGGRLWISGPNIMMGYLQEDTQTIAPLSTDGWYDTGDIAFVDEEGFMSLLGRARRFAKIGGEMVSFSAVENVLTTLWPEHLHAILSVSDAKKGEELVLLTNYPDAKRETIVRHMRHHGHAEILTPKKIHVIPDMPLLATGKINYVVLKEMV